MDVENSNSLNFGPGILLKKASDKFDLNALVKCKKSLAAINSRRLFQIVLLTFHFVNSNYLLVLCTH